MIQYALLCQCHGSFVLIPRSSGDGSSRKFFSLFFFFFFLTHASKRPSGLTYSHWWSHCWSPGCLWPGLVFSSSSQSRHCPVVEIPLSTLLIFVGLFGGELNCCDKLSFRFSIAQTSPSCPIRLISSLYPYECQKYGAATWKWGKKKNQQLPTELM